VLNYEIIKLEGCVRAEGSVKVHTFEGSVPMTRGSLGEKAAWMTGTVRKTRLRFSAGGMVAYGRGRVIVQC